MSSEMLINLKNVSISTLDKTLFEGLSLSVERGELIALVGANGCGKSSLLQEILARIGGERHKADAGIMDVTGGFAASSGLLIGYLPQYIDDVASILNDKNQSIRAGDIERLGRDFDFKIEAEKVSRLSEGERQKLAIVRAIASDYDLYLFDEPTNYLDIAGITAFEAHIERLKKQGKGIILITHDRTMTDNLADKTVLLTTHGIYHSVGGATAVFSVRRNDLDSRSRQVKDIGRKIRQLQDDMRQKAGWSAKSEKRKIGGGAAKPYFAKLSKKMAKRAKAAQKRAEQALGKLEEAKPRLPRKLNLSLPSYPIANRQVFSLEDLAYAYSSDTEFASGLPRNYLLKDISLAGSTRDKICLMGANGSGKSTLVRLIRKQLQPLHGQAILNDSVPSAVIPQGLAGFFNQSSLLGNFSDCGVDETTIRQYLGAALIRKDKVRESVGNFSYGELMRAAIVKCLLLKAEFLFLDEPTSHLDIESIEILERILRDFSGGYLIISHDRAFVENIADRLYMLDRDKLILI
ncbi:MAG: ABC-F family ATP-binding cassette domain-containing protein [FCB group bacterium]|nr:ABC-F family ATP-binding cassette domain-containing protein [FCB group bacterium]